MDHPFFNVKQLSDEDLLKKINDLTRRLNMTHLITGNSDMINQINLMIDMLNEERMERLNKQTFEMWNNQFPEIIETDPEFKMERPSSESHKPINKPANKTKRVPLVTPTFHKEYVKKDSKPSGDSK